MTDAQHARLPGILRDSVASRRGQDADEYRNALSTAESQLDERSTESASRLRACIPMSGRAR